MGAGGVASCGGAAITEPVALTREGVDVAVRARTTRFEVVLFEDLVRDATLREATAVERCGVIPREVTVLVEPEPRFTAVFEEVCDETARDDAVRATVVRLFEDVRGL